MATYVWTVVRVGSAAVSVMKPLPGRCVRQMSVRSRLYEHVRAGYSDRPELDMSPVCEDPERVTENLQNRKADLQGHDVRSMVQVWRDLEAVRKHISELEEQKSGVSKAVKELAIKNNNKAHKTLPEVTQILQRGRDLRHQLNDLYLQESELEEKHYTQALRLPNTTHPDVPVGDESRARLVELVGQKPEFDFEPRGHVELGEELGIIRQRHLAHVSGHRSYYLRGAGARLQTALQNFALDKLQQLGFVPLVVPDLLRGVVFEGCGMRPDAHLSQVYSLDPDRFPDLNLAGTGEVGVAGFFMDHAVSRKDLPVRTVCSSTCYRAETDTGRETWGLYRVHHFTKVEMFGVTANETGQESAQLLDEFVSLQKEIFSALELHCRVLDMPTEELGAPAHRKYDIEAWMPGRNSYGEISSGSNCTDYQSRRLNILYERDDGSLTYAHTVNATACAIPRTIIAILETHQTKEGTVRVPRALQPYLGLETIEKPKSSPLRYIGPNQRFKPTRAAPRTT
ncbi:serine--tRNA ligase, mitochondrial isoform X2 [Antennarius striatus]|uniref:serine--tRNA ligase, mitochondrial isoform X2 n=1 Tax=Antennarius striatus TaxID=241820 RepID=UPI0035B284FB